MFSDCRCYQGVWELIVKNDTRVSVLGLGYIGLPTAALLAHSGFLTSGYDTNPSVVDTVNRGKIHIVEEGLEEWVSSSIENGMLSASRQPQPADIYIVCVPTPFKVSSEGFKEPDITYVEAAIRSIAPIIKNGDLIILESTSPVGTTDYILELIRQNTSGVEDVYVAYCPERVLPGNILNEIVSNDRIIGGVDVKSTTRAAKFYRSFVSGNVLETNSKVAELCKLSENAFRDVNIAFANELSMVCETLSVDVWELISLANRHPRVNILKPGVGVGGHCIAVDPWFIVSSAAESTQLIKTARAVNDSKPQWVISQIEREVSRFEGIPKIACLGLSFKPDIDDFRESPALYIVDRLLDMGHLVSVVEPNVATLQNYDKIELEDAISACDIIVVLVRHKEFLTNEIRYRLVEKKALDFCGVLNDFS